MNQANDDDLYFKYEDMFNSSFNPKYVSMQWMNDGESFTYFKDGDNSKLYVYDALTDKDGVYLDSNNIIVWFLF